MLSFIGSLFGPAKDMSPWLVRRELKVLFFEYPLFFSGHKRIPLHYLMSTLFDQLQEVLNPWKAIEPLPLLILMMTKIVDQNNMERKSAHIQGQDRKSHSRVEKS